MDLNFTLLSDRLKEVGQITENSGSPVLRLWFEQGIGSQVLQEGAYDEENLLQVVEEMLLDTDRFLTEPEVVRQLQQLWEGLMARKKDYLKFALPKQKRRLEMLLQNPDYLNLEKREKDVRRYLAKAEAEMERLKSPGEKGRIVETIRLKLSRALGFEADLGLVEAALSGRIMLVGGSKSSVEKIKGAVSETVKKYEKDLADNKNSVDHFRRTLDILEQRMSTRGRLTGILSRTNLRLGELAAEEQHSNESDQQSSGPTSDNVVELFPQHKAQPDGEKNPERKRLKGQRKSVPGMVSEEAALEKIPDELGKLDLERLKKAVQIANGSTQKIRVLVPGDHISRYSQGWTELFQALGFFGRMEFGDYNFLAKTTDYDSPVIVPKKMNSFTGVWPRKSFSCVVVTELCSTNQLMSVLEREKKKAAV